MNYRNRIYITTYNGCWLCLDQQLTELEVELSRINWYISELSEVRRQGEDTITFESGDLLYFKDGDQHSLDGVGFLDKKDLVSSIMKYSSVSNLITNTETHRQVFTESDIGPTPDLDTL